MQVADRFHIIHFEHLNIHQDHTGRKFLSLVNRFKFVMSHCDWEAMMRR